MENTYLDLVSDNADISNNASAEDVDLNTFMGYLTDDNKQSIIDEVKGKSYDDNGNIIGEDGSVILSAEDFRKAVVERLTAPPQNIDDLDAITIDDIEYTINDKGEAIDKDGKVFKTREEIEAILSEQTNEDDEVDLVTVINEANAINGFELVDDNGNAIEFDNTPEGLAKRDMFLVDKYGSQIAENALQAMFTNIPELRQVYEYHQLNGNMEGFTFGETMLDIQLEKDNEAQHKSLIIRDQLAKGNDQATAELIAQSFIDDGKGFDMAKAALTGINARIEAKNKAMSDQLALKEQQDKAKQQQTYNSIKSIVDGGKLGDIPIPNVIKIDKGDGKIITANRNDFLNYYTLPNAEGKTQFQIDAANKSMEEKLIDAYLLFTGNKREDLIKGAATTQNITFRRKQLSNASSHSKLRSTGKFDIDKVKL